MAAAILWGAIAASSLVIGAALGLARKWPERPDRGRARVRRRRPDQRRQLRAGRGGQPVGGAGSVGVGPRRSAPSPTRLDGVAGARRATRRQGRAGRRRRPAPPWRSARSSTASPSSSSSASASPPARASASGCWSRSSSRTCRRRSARRPRCARPGRRRGAILRLWIVGRGDLHRSRPSPATRSPTSPRATLHRRRSTASPPARCW